MNQPALIVVAHYIALTPVKMQPTRTKTDDCLLCQSNKATATNSHIYPKFITQTMFGDKHAKSGNEINTAKLNYNKPATDVPKENYLMCPNCENIRLGRLEQKIADFFYKRYRNPYFIGDYPIARNYNHITKELDCIVCNGIHNGLFKLFVYSLVWRASVSTLGAYRNFKLSVYDEEILRHTLDTYLKDTPDETEGYYNANVEAFPQFQFVMLTAIDQVLATGNLVTEPLDAGNGTYQLCINEFMIIFYTKWNEGKKFERSYNPGPYPINIVLVPNSKWQETLRKLVTMFVDSYLAKHKTAYLAQKNKS